MTEELLVARDGRGVVTITFNRPEKRNAVTLPMYGRLGEVFDELDGDDGVRCVVLQGAGDKAFCAGSDIGEFDDSRSGGAQAVEYARFVNGACDKLRFTRHPTLAKIRGACVGGGLEIAAMCDLRIAAADSRFGIPVNRLGLTVDYEELAVLSELMGRRTTLEILLDGRIFGAEEALAKGLVSRVVAGDALDGEVEATATRLAESAPLVNRWHKAYVRRLADPAPLSEAERAEAYRCYDTEDYRSGTRAFAEKRKPVFAGR